MRAFSLGAASIADALRAVSALGTHRYVAGRLHLAHAFAFAALPDPDDGDDGVLAEGRAWARELLGAGGPTGKAGKPCALDASSRDEALWRRSTEAEVAAVLDAFWTPGPRATASRDALRALLERHDLALPEARTPFDESAEDAIHPVLIDAGWELVPLRSLHPERHRGAIAAFGDALSFESARFEEETAIPSPPTILELSAFGPTELVYGVGAGGELVEPLVVWAEGNETYVDYVIRGVRRAARLPEREE